VARLGSRISPPTSLWSNYRHPTKLWGYEPGDGRCDHDVRWKLLDCGGGGNSICVLAKEQDASPAGNFDSTQYARVFDDFLPALIGEGRL
jgi:hypothetical protein